MELFLNTFYFFSDVPTDLVGFTFFIGTMAIVPIKNVKPTKSVGTSLKK